MDNVGQTDELVQETYDKWAHTSDRYSNSSYYISQGVSPEEMAKNHTFSGTTTQSFSYGQNKSFATANNYNVFFDFNLLAGVIFRPKIDISTAPFGIGTINKGVEVDNSFGIKAKFNYSKDEKRSDANTVESQISYTLFDNEILDEISTTVVRGITPNHTPLFQVLGGKTSCPYEEGTLSKDNPLIQVVTPAGSGLYHCLKFQDPDEPAVFTITITNKSTTEDTRDIEVFLDNNSNPFGATIKLAGSNLGEQIFSGVEYDVPLQLTLTVERGVAYNYEGLRIGVRPACGDERFEQANIDTFITLDVHFQSPCSPISIVSPSDNWLINEVHRDLIIGLRDYEPATPNLEHISLEYRKLGTGTFGGTALSSGWQLIPYSNIKETVEDNNPVLPSTLAAYNTSNFGPGVTPTYFMVWEPDMGNASLFTDGEYEIRAVSTCKEGTIVNKIYSNVIRGTIDRSRMQVSATEPADGVWIAGDEVSVTFNKNVDCSLLLDPDFYSDSLRVFVADTLVQNATFTCFNNTVVMTLPDMSIYDGQMMRVSVEGLTDQNGNFAQEFDENGFLTKNIEWEFLITTSKAYWERDSIVVQVYEGDSVEITVGLRNTDVQTSLTNISLDRTTVSDSWLLTDPDAGSNFSINPGAVKDVTLTLIGTTEGVYYDTLVVSNLPGSGRQPALPIKLITVKPPPYPPDWVVNGNQYPNSMTVVANYTINNGPLSTDTLDQITAWIGGTLRGVGRIQRVGDPEDSTYVAYLTVYGSSDDNGTLIEFRVWDRSTDTEYNAYIDIVNEPAIVYGDNLFEGSTFAPRILHADAAAHYIYLNQGYTWISFNRVSNDMSVNTILSGLTSATPGDRILGQHGFSEYFDAQVGWFADASAELDTFSTEQTYMVYLQNGPDSIRVTGAPAPPYTKFLPAGTNWVGFPSQGSLILEKAIGVANLSDVTQIKNKDISRLSDGTSWTSGLLTEMVPNGGYKLFLDNLKPVTIPDSIVPPGATGDFIASGLLVSADPNDASTWDIVLDDYTYTDVIPVVGRIVQDSATVAGDGLKKVAAFINGELRGVGLIENMSQLSDSLFTLFIGKNDVDNGTNVKLYYFDGTAVVDSMTINIAQLTNNGHGLFNYSSPLIWNLDGCRDHLILTMDDSPLNGIYQARQMITISGDVQVLSGAQVTLSAPEVLANELDVQLGAVLEVLQTGCQ